MEDMRGLIVIVVIFAMVACDIAFNNSAILNWVGGQFGMH